MQRRVVGTLGEQAASEALQAQGYRILHRNYRLRGGELDIVATKGDTIAFCEVKTRTSSAYGLPEEAVTPTKRRRIRRLAVEYLQKTGQRAATLRFDVIAVEVTAGDVVSLRHLVGAF